jgi:hypothetical protein
MDEQKGGTDHGPQSDEHSLSVGKSPSANSPIESVGPPPPPSTIQQNIYPPPPDNPATNNQAANPDPLQVRLVNESLATRIIKDDELSIFERTTLRYARWGFGAAIFTLIVAVVTGVIFWGQFQEMISQTGVLEAGVKQSRIDAKNTARATAQQLSFAQQQVKAAQEQAKAAQNNLDILRRQFQQEQRPYIAITNVVLSDFITGKDIPTPVIGKPLAITIYFKNIGKSQALNLITHRHLLFGAKASEIRVEPPDINSSNGGMLESGIQSITTAVSVKDTFSVESITVNPSEIVNWDGSEPILVFGRISYIDSSGNFYCRPYVERLLQNGNWLIVESTGGRNIRTLCPKGQP